MKTIDIGLIIQMIENNWMNSPNMKLDALDHRILAELSENGRMSTLEIAQRVGLSPTPVGRRIKLMEEAGVITGYTVRIDPAALGMSLSVIVMVRLGSHDPGSHRQFLDAVEGRAEVTECLMVGGDADYMLRVWVRDIAALADFVPTVLQAIPCVAETSTTLVLRQNKSRAAASVQPYAFR